MLTIDYNSYRTTTPYGKRVRFLVLHYTALDFAASVKALTTGAASAHYLIPAPHDPSYKAAGFKGQRIFNLVAEEDRAWHAGVSGWARRDNLNDTSIGIEIVNLARDDDGVFTFPDYERSQINALKQLAKNILQRYPDMTPKNVVGHSDIAVGRKSASAAARDEGGTWVVIQPLRVNIPVTPGKMEFFHWIGPRVANLSPLFVAP